jgi:hypothetical protein
MSISEIVFRKRVEENNRELQRGEVIRGQYCDVYYFRDPSSFQEMYTVGIRIFEGNLTYFATDMSNSQVNQFFQNEFQDKPEFFRSSTFYMKFDFVGDDCDFKTIVIK